jgi:hypothetical protein
MPAYDKFHDAVRNALVKDGWTITHDPYTLELGGDRMFIDLGAERLLSAEKGTRKIAVEVKTFGGLSPLADLQQAVGQYVVYRILLRQLEPERELFLAVPQDTLQTLFQRPVGQGFIQQEAGKLIGYDSEQEEIIEWIP